MKKDTEILIPKEKESMLEQTVTQAWQGTPELHPEQKRRYLGTFEERVMAVLTESEHEEAPEQIKEAVAAAMEAETAAIVLIRADYIDHLVAYLKLARDRSLLFRAVSRPDITSDIILVVASARRAPEETDGLDGRK